MTVRHIGLNPVPNDENIEQFLQKIIQQNRTEMENFLKELVKTIDETEQSGQPNEFAYGKMLNYLATEESVTQAWLINSFAAAIWELL